MNRTITGRHVFFMLLAFFGLIAAVNFNMARLAISNFGGTVVDNSYVASQRYNEWIAAQAAQEARGWSASAERMTDGRVAVHLQGLAADSVSVRAEHPTRKTLDYDMAMRRAADGVFASAEPLPAGRWSLRVIAQTGGEEARFLLDIPPS